VDALAYVAQLAAHWSAGAREGIEIAPKSPKSTYAADSCTVAIVSPHPDDECIVGGLALRLQRECGARVVNLAVTLGSNVARQAARAQELRGACDYLDFECVVLGERGLDRLAHESQNTQGETWMRYVTTLSRAFESLQPALIIAPHATDAQSTHIATHALTRAAVEMSTLAQPPTVAWSEYWSTMSAPNLLVTMSEPDVAALISALTFHRGEIERNPYHLGLPMWMNDAVRRGSELVGGAGAAALQSPFATLYHAQTFANGAWSNATPHGRVVSTTSELAQLLG
jgi:N-acetylglucosamine malate deacetylase 1